MSEHLWTWSDSGDAVSRCGIAADTEGMSDPVKCARCPRIYDLGAVEVVARYADCSMWRCCNSLVDDRSETGWKSQQDYHRIGRRP